MSHWPEAILDFLSESEPSLKHGFTQFIMELAVQPPFLRASYLFHLLLAALLFEYVMLAFTAFSQPQDYSVNIPRKLPEIIMST